MYQLSIIQKTLANKMHKARLSVLKQMVRACFVAQSLTVTHLGRALDSSKTERGGIKKADRFLSNDKMYEEYPMICNMLISHLISEKSCPWILVDWSKMPHKKFQVLRAALVANGRSITIYEEVHGEKKLGNAKVHKKFLAKLKELLPMDCCPIIITDAGFGVPWFKDVLNLGWDYVGRIRGNKYYSLYEDKWLKIQDFKTKYTHSPKYIGTVLLTKQSKFNTDLYVTKEKSKGRHAFNKSGNIKKDSCSKSKSKAANEPLCLVTSLQYKHNMADKVVKIYKTRMQVEEGFRDLKSTKFGFGFEHMMSYKPRRILILLLISMLASFIAYITGRCAEQRNLHLQFQANSIKHIRVLSFFYLGRRIIKKYLQGNSVFHTKMLESDLMQTQLMLENMR